MVNTTSDLHLFENIPTNTTNSFIANVNKLAKNFAAMNQLLQVPDTVQQMLDDITTKYNTVTAAESDVTTKYHHIEAMYGQIQIYNTETRDNSFIAIDAANNAKNSALEAYMALEKLIATQDLTSLAFNIDNTYKLENDITVGDSVDFISMVYIVGRNNLEISWEGVKLYKDIHYREVGQPDSFSSEIVFLIDIPSGHRLNLWSIASNLTPYAEQKLKEMQDKLDEAKVYVDVTSNNAIEATEQADRAEQAATDAELAYLQVKDSVKYYQCSLPMVSLVEHEDEVPALDCFFVYTVDLDCIGQPNIPVEPDPNEPTPTPVIRTNRVCGQRINLVREANHA